GGEGVLELRLVVEDRAAERAALAIAGPGEHLGAVEVDPAVAEQPAGGPDGDAAVAGRSQHHREPREALRSGGGDLLRRIAPHAAAGQDEQARTQRAREGGGPCHAEESSVSMPADQLEAKRAQAWEKAASPGTIRRGRECSSPSKNSVWRRRSRDSSAISSSPGSTSPVTSCRPSVTWPRSWASTDPPCARR